MYSQNHAAMAPPQKPETFMLSNEAQQSLPQDAQVALQQVDNRELNFHNPRLVFFRGCLSSSRSVVSRINSYDALGNKHG